MQIAVLGMGRMGQAVAGRLLDGHHGVVIWNRTPGKAADLVTRGACEAEDVADAVTGVDVVITSLANDDAVRHVVFDAGGVLDSIGEATTYLDASTVSPALVGELDTAFPRFGAMPILGAPVAVASGEAVYLLGGDATVGDAAQPLMASLSDKVRRYDSPPLASAAKLASNLLLLDGIVALAESFSVGRAGGLSDDQLRDLLGESPLVAPALKNRFEGVLTGDQDPWWSTALGAKDAGLAVDVAGAAGRDLPSTSVVRDMYRRAASAGLADADVAEVSALYRG